ncbi:YDG domain-containing protein [beta proteobacterium MWH-UniP1]
MGSSVALAQLPTGGQIVGGAGTISSSGTTMTVTQTTDRMAANWQSFNIGKGNTVNFVQPNSNSVALNRVLGSDVSVIQGALNANGKLFLINPNGVLFTKDSHVNVGSLVASTLNITTENFMAGNYRFEGASSNAIINQGNITANGDGAGGGTVALITAKIVNQGAITAHKGNVLMGAGSRVTLNLGGPVSIEVEQGALDALIEQGGAIKADGGLVYLTAKAANDIVTTVINHTGVTEAQTLATGQSGKIYLMGDMAKGRVEVAGTLDASAPNGGDGGFVETSAATLKVHDGAAVRAGHWLIDPTNITVDAGMATTLQGQLSTGNATVTTARGGVDAGDIFLNAGITWSSGKTLTLRADRNIEINATLDASGGSGGRLSLEYGQGAKNGVLDGLAATYTINAPVKLRDSGAANGSNLNATNFATKFGSTGAITHFTTLSSLSALDAIDVNSTSLRGSYALGADLSLASMTAPIGNSARSFTGRFDGLGNTLSGLTLTGASYLGLFGTTGLNSFISNLKLNNFNLTATGAFNSSAYMGALVGRASGGSYYNLSYSNMTFSGGTSASTDAARQVGVGMTGIGGLIGIVGTSGVVIEKVRGSGVTIEGERNLGGLVGSISLSSTTAAKISDVQLDNVSLTITGAFGGQSSEVGGLAGALSYTTVQKTAVSNLTVRTKNNQNLSNGFVGGLVGSAYFSDIDKSFAHGSIDINNYTTIVSHPGATGSVGGLVGFVFGGSVSNSYALTDVTVNNSQSFRGGIGGLVGRAEHTSSTSASINNSYSAGKVSAGNLSGTNLNYIGGSIGTIQTSTTNASSGISALTITNVFWDRDASTRSNAIGTTSMAAKTGSTAIGALLSSTGSTAFDQAGYTGFDFTNVWASYTGIRPILRALQSTVQVKVDSVAKTYDKVAWNSPTYTATSGAPVTGTISLAGTAVNAVNAGTYSIQASGLTLNQSTHLDYQKWSDLSYIDGTLKINPKTLTLSGLTAANKVYDAGVTATLTGTASISAGVISGDTVSLTGTAAGTFADKNVGTSKTVTVSGLSLANNTDGNYTLSVPTLSANISKAPLSLSGLTASGKTYDGKTTATLTGSTSIKPLGSDDVALSGVVTGTFADANAGVNKPVTVSSVMLVGKDAGNYEFTSPTGLTATISKAALRVNANEFVSSAGTTPTKISESGCVDLAACVSGITLTGSNLGLTFASGALASNYNTTLWVSNSGGRLNVARPLSWSGFNLALSAVTDIHITSTLTASGATDKVSLLYGQGAVASGNTAAYRFGLTDTGFAGKLNLQAGQNLITKLGSNGDEYTWTVVSNRSELQNISLSGRSALGADVDASGSAWTALGNATTKFTGQFDGLGHTVSGLKIDKSSDTANNYQGLFGWAIGASFANIGIESPTIEAARYIGGLVGEGYATSITQSYVKNAALTGERGVGGLAGFLRYGSNVTDSFATGKTQGNIVANIAYHGGLIGIVETFDAGSKNVAANIRRSFANVSITPTGTEASVAGGLVGLFRGAGVIEDSFALGDVRGRNDGSGGLVGRLGDSSDTAKSTVTRSYASGAVSTNGGTAGGLIGLDVGSNGATSTVTNSVWNTITSGQPTSAGGARAVGKTNEQMQTLNTFANWNAAFTDATSYAGISDFRQPSIAFDGVSVWKMNPKYIPYTLSEIGTDKYTYNAQAQTPAEWDSKTVLGSVFAGWVLGTDYIFTHSSSNSTGFTNAGVYNPVSVTILRSGYNNASTGNTTGSLTIDKAALTVRANDDARFVTQSENTSYSGVSYSGFKGGDTVSVLTGTPTIARSDSTNNNTGSYTLTPSGLSSDKYSFNYENGTYQIVGADKMLVKAGTINSIYGQTVDWATPIVQYVAGGNVLTLEKQSQTGAAFVFQEGSPNTANTVSFTLAPTGTTLSTSNNVKAGTYALTGTGFVANTPNYTGGEAKVVYSGQLVVAPKAITVSYSASKTYDALTSFAPSVTYSGVITNDVVSFTRSGTYNSKNVGTNLGYSLTLTASGTDAANYVITNAKQSGSDFALSGTNGEITKADLTVSGLTASNKIYDGTVNATLGGTASVTALDSDTVSVSGSAVGVFADKNVGTNKAITVSGVSLTGADAGNYNLVQQTGLKADITAKNITEITKIAAADKTYDGTNTAALNTDAAGFTGIVAGDELTVSGGSGTFADKDAGTGKTVSITGLALGGADAGNYNLTTTTASATATIARASISAVTGISAANKVYDGTTDATIDLSGVVLSGKLNGDSLTITAGPGAFSNKDAGDSKTVNISGITLDGADKNNYVLASGTATTTANITRVPLTITANGDSKTYDGVAYSDGNGLSFNGFITGENSDVLSGSLSYGGNSQGAVNVGNYVITPGGLTSSNYDISFVNGQLKIDPRPIKVVANDLSKTRGASDPVFTWRVLDDGLVAGDTFAGAISRAAGEAEGTYAINGNSLVNSNYVITFEDGIFTINPRSTGSDRSTQSAAAYVQRTIAKESTQLNSRSIVRSDSSIAESNPAFLVTSQQPSVSLSGGLAFVRVDQPNANADNSTGADASSSGPTAISNVAAGRDPAGFMRVFVVRGGVSLPQAAATQLCAAGGDC